MLIFLKALAILSVLIFIVGLIRPKWILFFMKNPDRLTVTSLAMLLFMAAWTGIAKLTLKPREQVISEQQAADKANRLDLTR